MKKIFMFLAVAGLMTFSAMAQTEEVVADSVATEVATEEVAAPAEEVAPVCSSPSS